MIKRILVGLGKTPFTSMATKIATELGDLHRAQLTGVTVVDTSKLNNLGPVPVGGAAYAQRMHKRKAQITKEGTEQAIAAFKSHCSEQQVVCRRIKYEERDPFSVCAAYSITGLPPTRTKPLSHCSHRESGRSWRYRKPIDPSKKHWSPIAAPWNQPKLSVTTCT